ncbi:hypothetical protein [Agarilytica rhodophyticola]|uniref:hypothetical protein n=1 Tax=Agarilytica rhodophyticola TaxID=1737490 RepID=UPI000B347682|nr:hypothetical protein [Agarilytica rhodophyticola]
MDRYTISYATEALEELHQALIAAYWDSNCVSRKDTVFDILSTISAELSELAKLSIEDHNMGYEPVSVHFPECARKIKQLQNHIDEWFARTETAQKLHTSISNVINLTASKFL